MAELNRQVIVITGAAGAVGRVVAQRFVQAGATVALWDQKLDSLQSLHQQLDPHPLTVAVDLTDPDAVDAGIVHVLDAYQRIDGLVHIAGGFAMPGAAHEGHLNVWHHMLALNATALYITAGKIAQQMLKTQSKGSITAIVAKAAQRGMKHAAAYSASKAAALRVVESMAEDLKPHGIRVNAVSPSIIDTPANRQSMGEANVHKWVTPDEIAETLLFLASDRASAMTGANLELNGRV